MLGGVGPVGADEAAAGPAGKPPVPGTDTDANGVRRSLSYLGVHRPGDAAGCSEPEALESMLGRTFAINHYFRSPPETAWAPLRDSMLADKRAGRIPMLSAAAGRTPGYPDDADGQLRAARARLTEIANGARDSYIDAQAAALAALATPVFLRSTWEFDLRYLGSAGAEAFQSAWRHVWTRFQREGAANVAFVWCPTWLAYHDGTARTFYPGDRYVDWIGADGYSRCPDYRSFSSLFAAANVFAIEHGKPFMAAETGVHRLKQQRNLRSGSTEQSAWLDELRRNLDDNRFPNMKALVYFHTDGTNDPLPNHWRVTVPANGPAWRSFRSLAWHPRLKAAAPAPRPSPGARPSQPALLSWRVR
jgi:hypothetical protein